MLIYDKYCVYGIFNKEIELIYIGRTEYNLDKRFNNHISASKRNDRPINIYLRNNKDCYIEPLYYCKNYFQLKDKEKELIRKYNPPYNSYQY
jgi:hypothetical protein